MTLIPGFWYDQFHLNNAIFHVYELTAYFLYLAGCDNLTAAKGKGGFYKTFSLNYEGKQNIKKCFMPGPVTN